MPSLWLACNRLAWHCPNPLLPWFSAICSLAFLALVFTCSPLPYGRTGWCTALCSVHICNNIIHAQATAHAPSCTRPPPLCSALSFSAWLLLLLLRAHALLAATASRNQNRPLTPEAIFGGVFAAAFLAGCVACYAAVFVYELLRAQWAR